MGLLGSGSKGRSNNRSFAKGSGGTTPPGVDMLRPQESGNPDVVHDRQARATTGVMQKRQLLKNKSVGLRSFGKGSKVKGDTTD